MRSIVILLGCLCLIGCGSQQPASPPKADRIIVTGPSPTNSQAGPQGDELLAKIDLPLYPGSKIVSSTIQIGDQIPKDEHRYHVQLETSDPIDKVIGFYKTKGTMTDSTSPGKSQLLGLTPKGNRTIIMVEEKAGKTLVSISSIAYEATR